MDRQLSAILGPVIKKVIASQRYLWGQLKWDIDSLGPWSGEVHELKAVEYFHDICEREITRLDNEAFNKLVIIYYQRFGMGESGSSPTVVRHFFTMTCVEEILRRARIAASRTDSW